MTEPFPSAARDQTPLRRSNELSVLAVLRDGAARPLREISEMTGLSWRSTQVVAEALYAHGWLAETEAGTGTAERRAVGRPARHYRFRAEVGHVIGLDVGTHRVHALVADLAGEIVGSHRVETSPGDPAHERLAATENAIRAALADGDVDSGDVWAAAMGTSGVIGPDGTVTASVLLPGWTGLNPGRQLESVLPCKVEVANDANMAALAERWRGHRAQTMIYVMAGVRLGVGLLIDGHLHRGAAGAAGEIGLLDGVGWGDAAERLASAADAAAPQDRDAAADLVFEAARAGSPVACAAVDTFAADLARGITPMVLTIDPELVVLGGGFSRAADLLLPRLQSALTASCLHAPSLEASRLGDEAVIFGALRMALDAVDRRMTGLSSSIPFAPAAIRGW